MMFKAGFNGYSVKFSPYHEGRLAVATAQNFGIIGNGRWAPPPLWAWAGVSPRC